MKSIIQLCISLALVSCFIAAHANPIDFTKNSSQINKLGSAWKNYKSVTPKSNKNDIIMGYAGKDILSNPTIVPHSITL